MTEILITDLPNARELAAAPEFPEYESSVLGLEAMGDNILQREQLMRDQGGKTYVQEIAGSVRSRANGNSLFAVDNLRDTGLTRYMSELGVDTDSLKGVGQFRLFGKIDVYNRHVLDLEYQIRKQDSSILTFWELSLNGFYGFVNLRTRNNELPQPLTGQGNITSVRGVRKALTIDSGIIAQSVI